MKVSEVTDIAVTEGQSALQLVHEGQVQSLLSHPEIVADEACCDATFDLLLLLRGSASVMEVAAGYCALRRVCGDRCYLPVFRLRRWLERSIEVRCAEGAWEALSLQDADFERSLRRLRARAWEMNLQFAAPEDVPLFLRWSVPAAETKPV